VSGPATPHDRPWGEAQGGRPGGDTPERELETERAYEYFQIGRRFLAERRPAQAAMYLERALRLVPDKNSVREALGRSYYALGRYEGAAREFEELLRRAPATDYAHFALARCLLKLGDVAGARGEARLAVAMSPDNDDYRRALDDCLAAG